MPPQPNRLVMRTGPTPGKTFTLSKTEINIGRDIINDIVINDAEVSRRHAKLTLYPEGFMLEDLGSTNGTFVDGRRITAPYLLRPGQLIMLADNVSLLYEGTPLGDRPAAEEQPEVMEPALAEAQTPAEPVSYTAQPIEGPLKELPQPPERRRRESQLWLMAGCGCLVLLVCAIFFAIAYYIDINNLWCSIPLLSDILPCS